MKGIGARSGYRKTQLPNYYNVQTYAAPVGVTRWGVHGVYGYRTTEDLSAKGQAEARVRTQERIRGNMSANMTVQGVEAATADAERPVPDRDRDAQRRPAEVLAFLVGGLIADWRLALGANPGDDANSNAKADLAVPAASGARTTTRKSWPRALKPSIPVAICTQKLTSASGLPCETCSTSFVAVARRTSCSSTAPWDMPAR